MTHSPRHAIVDPAAQRARMLRRSIGLALPARAAQALAPLVVIPWLLNYLGAPLYGFWMATTAAVAMMSFSDLGLGNAVMSRLPPLLASGRFSSARTLLTSSYALLAAISALLLLASGLFAWIAPLGAILGFAGSQEVLRGVFLVTCLAFLSNIPLSLIMRVQMARQRSGETYIVSATAALLSMPLTLLAVNHDLGPVLVVAINLSVAPMVNITYTLLLFTTSLRQLRPAPSLFRLSAVRDALGGGLPFLALTVLLAIASAVDYLLIGRLFGSAQVAEYSVPARLLAQIGALVSLMNMPFWPASSEALARHDLSWVDRTRRRMTMFGFSVTTVACVCLVLATPMLYKWWLGETLPLSIPLVAGLATWWVIQATLSPTFMVQNGLAVVVPQFLGFSAYLAISVPLKMAGAPVWGLASVPWISTACLLVTVVPSALYGYSSATRAFRSGAIDPRDGEPS